MARPNYTICLHFLILLTFAYGSTADDRASFGEIQERLQKLETNYNVLKIDLESKVARLEELVKVKDRQHDILQEKVVKLEFELHATNSKRKSNSLATKNAMFRTCNEARTADPSLTSGMYLIDPDGQSVGDPPINVFCDMTTGKTSILHDSEAPMDVGHCADPGCYSREINYTATMRQMTTLVELSSECHQSIKYDCNYAPFETNGVTYSWWNDRNGNEQYFWAGSDSSAHTCQCGIDGNCIDSIVKCNCDATVPLLLNDNGVITAKTILPITKLNFGRTQLSSSSGAHTLGRFECSGGDTTVTGMPTSCEDLWRMGHSLSGLYFVMEGKLVKNVYCDFTKLSGEAGFQSLIGYAEVKPKPTYFGIATSCANLKAAGHTSSGLYSVAANSKVQNVFCDFTKSQSDPAFQRWIGFVDVQSTPVYFYVQRSSSFEGTGQSLTFDVVRINTGNAMNAGNGRFTAPVSGTYFFSFSGIAYMVGTTSDGKYQASLRKDGEQIGQVKAEMTQGLSTDSYSLQSTLFLQAGQQIWVQPEVESKMYLIDSGNHYTHFTGWLLQEDVAL